MGDIPSAARSEQPRLVKVGKGHYSETWPEDLGFNLKPVTIASTTAFSKNQFLAMQVDLTLISL